MYEMKIVQIHGGLGNQMFQYAFAKALAHAEEDVRLDLSWFSQKRKNETPRDFQLDVFNVKMQKCRLWDKLFCKKVKETQRNVYEPALLNIKGRAFYSGFFQTSKYFENIRKEILNDFSLKVSLTQENAEPLKLIEATNSVSLHVRRGDYLTAQAFSVCDLKYYEKAIDFIMQRVKNPHFFLFSDDIPWVKENLKIDAPCTAVDINDGRTAYFDLELMKHCHHNIIANSTFSWWGAWLNQNNDKIVICPKKWYADNRRTDILPDDWVKIDV